MAHACFPSCCAEGLRVPTNHDSGSSSGVTGLGILSNRVAVKWDPIQMPCCAWQIRPSVLHLKRGGGVVLQVRKWLTDMERRGRNEETLTTGNATAAFAAGVLAELSGQRGASSTRISDSSNTHECDSLVHRSHMGPMHGCQIGNKGPVLQPEWDEM
jgi:hypothetical protein